MPSNKFAISLKNNIRTFNKSIEVDSDKSLSIRTFLIGSICQNISTTKNILESEDVFSTISNLQKLGIKIVRVKTGSFISQKKFKIKFR